MFDLKIASKWVGEETIKVAAGTFKAWKLQTITIGEDYFWTISAVTIPCIPFFDSACERMWQ